MSEKEEKEAVVSHIEYYVRYAKRNIVEAKESATKIKDKTLHKKIEEAVTSCEAVEKHIEECKK